MLEKIRKSKRRVLVIASFVLIVSPLIANSQESVDAFPVNSPPAISRPRQVTERQKENLNHALEAAKRKDENSEGAKKLSKLNPPLAANKKASINTEKSAPLSGPHKQFEVRSRMTEDKRIIREAEIAAKDQNVKRDLNHLESEMKKGNVNAGIGSVPTKGLNTSKVNEMRARKGARIYYPTDLNNTTKDPIFTIIAKSSKTNQERVISLLDDLGY